MGDAERTLACRMRRHRLDGRLAALAAGAAVEPQDASLRCFSAYSLLHLCGYRASYASVARRLVSVVDLHARNVHGETALHVAAKSCNPRTLKILLDWARDCMTSDALKKLLEVRFSSDTLFWLR